MKLFFRFIVFIIFLLPFFICCSHKEGCTGNSLQKEVSRHIQFLCSDELLGRKTGEMETKIAARYIAESFREYNLKTVPGLQDYLQAIKVFPNNEKDSLSCNNVVGYIEGTDSLLKSQYVLLMAHYDHLGVKKNARTPDDSIYNGARDNGMGVAALLLAAKMLAGKPHKRSILFLATSAEEMGMLGSRYFVNHCPLPVKNIVFVLNNDGGGFNDTTLIRIGGMQYVDYPLKLSKIVEEKYKIKSLSYPGELNYLYEKGDNVVFAERNIPSITISPGFKDIDDEILKYIHQPCDEVNPDFNLSYLYTYSLVYTQIADFLSGMNTLPYWTKDSKYNTKNIKKTN